MYVYVYIKFALKTLLIDLYYTHCLRKTLHYNLFS